MFYYGGYSLPWKPSLFNFDISRNFMCNRDIGIFCGILVIVSRKHMLYYFYPYMFCKVHSIGPINMCTYFEINRHKIDEFRKHAKSYVLFDVT